MLEHHVGLRQPGGTQAAGLAVDHQQRVGVGRGGVQLQQGLQGGAAQAAPAAAAPVGVRPDEVMATLEKLADLKAKGILTQEEFDTKKAELLKKLV